MVKFAQRKITCKHPGCNERFFAKDKFIHHRNKHSDVLEGKTIGSIIAVKKDVSSPHFACAFCLVKNTLRPMKTHQNMKFHQSKHHRGEEMAKTKSQLKDLLRALACRGSSTPLPSFYEAPMLSFSGDVVDDPSVGDDMGLCSQPASVCEVTVDSCAQIDEDDHSLCTQSASPYEVTVDSFGQIDQDHLHEDNLPVVASATSIINRSQLVIPSVLVSPSCGRSIVSVLDEGDSTVESENWIVDGGSLNVYEMVEKRERFLRTMNKIPLRKQQLCDSAATLPSSTIGCIITALAWTNVLLPYTMKTPFKVLDVGSGCGKSAFFLSILSGGLAKVVGLEVIEIDCFISMRDSHACNHCLPDNKKMETLFLACNESILNVASADGFNAMCCQVRGMNADAHQNIAKCYNNSNVEVLLLK